MKRIKVSVIVPVYNVERYVARCLDSILAQTLRELEIIIVNDGSTDRSLEICKRYMGSDKRITLISKPNAGLGMARNSGLDAASGEYVAFVDSDDHISPRMFERLYATAADTGSEAVACRYENVKGDIPPVSTINRGTRIISGKKGINGVCLDMIASGPDGKNDRDIAMSACCWLYPMRRIRDLHARFHSEREYVCEDLLFNLQLLPRLGRIALIDEPMYFYRENPNSLSLTVKPERLAQNEKLYHKIIEVAVEDGFDRREVTERADRFLIGYNRYSLKRIARSDMPGTDIMDIIRKNCENSIWREIHDRYPLGRLPLKYNLMQRLIQLKSHNLIYCLLRYSY